ncbi:hypothetical protein DGG96_01990 [Legionella qingyii]|uniref:GALA protein n=1 Tax=Legionella qingyii TaxID=2184757 RepID=A0A317U7N3_9GAMM|nr:hypothetical protein [Legionella qingyii]PWY57509.1 hypothetical protein DGG96_01990 [Legionella qingyii]RUR23307.1 hypothetical protein ELY16_13230 [Legionella qingyii]RUR26593.1 hypothetical protein ELY20_01355 [Legionella qingyii]
MPKYRKINLNEAIFLLQNNVPDLVSLDLSDQEISEQCLYELVNAINANIHLKRIKMNGCMIDDDKIKILSRLGSIEVLSLRANKISDKGLRLLATIPSLKKLDLSSNNNRYDKNITAKGLKFFVRNSTLEQLILSDNELNDECAKTLAKTNLRRLILSNNQITHKGVSYLAVHKKLNFLDISTNKIGDAGAITLINENLRIRGLVLNNNKLSIKAIAKMNSEKLKKLDRLDICLNPLGQDGIKLLQDKRGSQDGLSTFFCQKRNRSFIKGLFNTIHTQFLPNKDNKSEQSIVFKCTL